MKNLISNNYIIFVVITGATLIGFISGILGTILTLKKEALVGNALAHASFPGAALSFILIGNKNIYFLLLGAGFFSTISLIIVKFIEKYSKTKKDAIFALILSGFFGLGQILMSIIQNSGNIEQAGLEKFIFGEIATISFEDIKVILIVSIIVILIIFFMRKEIKLFIFDEEFYKSLGFSAKYIEGLIFAISVIVVMFGIRYIGVILMTSVLVAPSIAAKMWSNSFYNNMIFSGVIGGISGFLGTIISIYNPDLSLGPIVVIFSTLIAIVSIIFKGEE